jgi:hypothetical protein
MSNGETFQDEGDNGDSLPEDGLFELVDARDPWLEALANAPDEETRRRLMDGFFHPKKT